MSREQHPNVAQLFETAVRHHQAGQLSEAQALYRRILSIDPNHIDAMHLLGVLAHQSGRNDIAVYLIGNAIARNDQVPDFHYNIGLAHGALGHFEDAARHFGRVVELRPQQLQAHLNLGNALRRLGRIEEAATRYEVALSLNPDVPEAHYNLSNVLMDLGRVEEAIAATEHAISLRPRYAEAHNTLGTALKDQGKLTDAVAAFRHALEYSPGLLEARLNLGNALSEEGDHEGAEAAYRQALTTDPGFAEAHLNLGSLLMLTDRLDDARTHFEQAIAIKPSLKEAHLNLARALLAVGDPAQALNAVRASLDISETAEAKVLFAECLSKLDPNPAALELRGLLLRALSEPWARPQQLSPICARIIKLTPAAATCIARVTRDWPARPSAIELFGWPELHELSSDPLLRCLLETTQVVDLAIEQLLTAIRSAFLDLATGAAAHDAVDDSRLRFFCAIARQCFINEFVFSLTDPELEQAKRLRDSVAAAIASGSPITPPELIAVASYFPLHSLPGAISLLQRPWGDPVSALLVQQVSEPESEQQLRGAIPRLTHVEDRVSLVVQQQYEENPYPRWLKIAPVIPYAARTTGISGGVLPASIERFMQAEIADILVVGCGTGQQAIEVAQGNPDAHVLAIDLSVASLAYARRMTDSSGVKNIEYAQADIAELGNLTTRFDAIFAGGVLHHMADPFAGWRILRCLLRRGGIMDIALYSELGRSRIVHAQQFARDRNYRPVASDIRQLRDEVIAQGSGALFNTLTSVADFYSVSECRDMLLHVQEHCLTLPEIAQFLASDNLKFIGFRIDPTVRRRYRAQFPQDANLTDLANWHQFETENPNTFLNMYQFLVQDAV